MNYLLDVYKLYQAHIGNVSGFPRRRWAKLRIAQPIAKKRCVSPEMSLTQMLVLCKRMQSYRTIRSLILTLRLGKAPLFATASPGIMSQIGGCTIAPRVGQWLSVPELCYTACRSGYPPRIDYERQPGAPSLQSPDGALSEWQNNIEFGLYDIKQACSGDKRTADTYITLFEKRNFRERLAQVNHLILASFSNTAHHADWLKLHSRIERAAKGRNALAHHWVLTYPNDKPGRRWCLIPRPVIMKQGSPQKLPPSFEIFAVLHDPGCASTDG